MIRLGLLVISAIFLGCTTGLQAAEPSPGVVSAETLKAGKAAYVQGMCAKCHGEDGRGGARAPDLTDDEWLHADGSIESIRALLVSGVSRERMVDKSRPFAMNPATNLIGNESIDALAAYVWSLSQ
jgi:mono/diheme cytochrome c family protein